MSALLESALTDAQREACARNDAALISSMFPLEGGFTEAELQAADLERLARQQLRERQRIGIVTQEEIEAMRRNGWL